MPPTLPLTVPLSYFSTVYNLNQYLIINPLFVVGKLLQIIIMTYEWDINILSQGFLMVVGKGNK